MSILIDLILIGIIALFTFIGYKQGLVKAAIKILSFFIAIIVALAIYKPVSTIVINNTQIDDNIKNVIVEKMGVNESNENAEVKIEDNLTSKIVGEVNTTVSEMANAFSIKLVETATLLIIFILMKIALKFVTILTDLITKLPLIKQINKLRRDSIWHNKRNTYSVCNTCDCLFDITYDETRSIKAYR